MYYNKNMGTNLSSHEYIREIIWKSFKGHKISKKESQKLEQAMLSFDQKDWRNFKIILKQSVKELLEQELEKLAIPEQWKSEYKIFFQALANFLDALFSEELITEAVNCEKLKIPLNQRLNRLLPLVTKQMKTMAKRKPASTTVDYKTENSFSKKIKEAKILIFSHMFRGFTNDHANDEQWMTKIKKMFGLIKSLTPGEIKVLKGKGKRILWHYLDKYYGQEFANVPPLKDFVQAGVELVDAIYDENLVSEGLKMTIEVLEAFIRQINLNYVKNYEQGFEKFSESEIQKIFIQKVKGLGLENRLLNQLRNNAQHLNLLAGGEANSQISDADEREIARKLQGAKTERENNNSQEQRGLSFISPAEIFSSLENQGPRTPSNNREFNWSDEINYLDKELSGITLTKPKWYERPWLLGIVIVGVFVLGIFISWLIFRRKEKSFQEKGN